MTVADKNGLLVPRGNNHIQFAIEGPAEIVAMDNGDATSFESFQATERNAYNGLALVIVRSHAGAPGTIVLKAVSPGLASAEVTIKSKPSGTIIRPGIPEIAKNSESKWRRAPRSSGERA